MSEQEPRFIRMYDIFSGDLFQKEKYTLVIPNYQRGYKWAVKDKNDPEHESSVEYLIKTIMESFKVNAELFLQGITVAETNKKEGKSIIIIDGQQRITTLYLLLWYLDPTLISMTELKYDAREDTDACLKKLKEVGHTVLNEAQIGDITIQDIYFIKEAIHQISSTLGEMKPEKQFDFISYLKHRIKVIYIPIAHKEDAVHTFTMMNGSKAIMRAEELIKAELLRMVSETYRNFSFEASSIEEVLVKLRDFSAMDWNTAEARSRYAREWDKWLYWWNRTEVKSFFRTTTESRPLGLLLDYFYRNADKEHNTYSDFRQFQTKLLQSDASAHNTFKRLRQLQKQFEDVYNDYYTHNMLCMALSCGDRYDTIAFFLNHLNDSSRDMILKRFTEARIIGLSCEKATTYAIGLPSTTLSTEIENLKNQFIDSLLNQYVYNQNDENAFRYLSYRNILETNKLKERFNATIFLDRSLEHIHPRSKVYHIDDETHRLMRGDESAVSPEAYDYPDPMPEGVIKRNDIRSDMDKLVLSEHSICNLVLLYGKNNSEFGNKSFLKKKEIFFQVTDQKKIFISRTLQHTLSKFAKPKWDVDDMIEYYKETRTFLQKDFMI